MLTFKKWEVPLSVLLLNINTNLLRNSLLAWWRTLSDYFKKWSKKISSCAFVCWIWWGFSCIFAEMKVSLLRNVMNRYSFFMWNVIWIFYGEFERQYPFWIFISQAVSACKKLGRCWICVRRWFGYLALYFWTRLRGNYVRREPKTKSAVIWQ